MSRGEWIAEAEAKGTNAQGLKNGNELPLTGDDAEQFEDGVAVISYNAGLILADPKYSGHTGAPESFPLTPDSRYIDWFVGDPNTEPVVDGLLPRIKAIDELPSPSSAEVQEAADKLQSLITHADACVDSVV